MELLILADYYEEKGFIAKSIRLKKRSSKVLCGWHNQYTYCLGKKFTYGYHQGNSSWFDYGSGEGYWRGNGWYYS